VTIPSGSSVKTIAKILKDSDLIRSSVAFEQYIRNNGLTSSLQAGTYALQPSQSVQEIVAVITEGKIKTDLVTILPASRIDQVRKTLINNGFTESEADDALDPDNYKNHPALVDKPVGAGLEGYLYPDSFQKNSETTAKDIIRLSLDEMSQKLTAELRAKIERQGLTVYEGITLASIVEQEVSSQNDRTQAAQVFLKRLRTGMVLGSDVTVFYGAIAAGKEPSLQYDSLYNTHIHAGLTPTPISNVSESSLNAVANPASTDWLYFVSGDDGITYFSKTLEEHESLTALHCKKLCDL
jgi:UPF0755 protein